MLLFTISWGLPQVGKKLLCTSRSSEVRPSTCMEETEYLTGELTPRLVFRGISSTSNANANEGHLGTAAVLKLQPAEAALGKFVKVKIPGLCPRESAYLWGPRIAFLTSPKAMLLVLLLFRPCLEELCASMSLFLLVTFISFDIKLSCFQ